MKIIADRSDSSVSTVLEENTSKLQKMIARVEAVAEELSVFNAIKIGLFSNPLQGCLGYADLEENTIYFSPILLFDLERLPKDLLPNGSTDKRLFDLDYLQQISNFISDNFPPFKFPTKKAKITIRDLYTLKLVLLLKEDPEKFEMAMKALIAHEIGHLYYGHKDSKIKQISLNILSLLIGAGTFAILSSKTSKTTSSIASILAFITSMKINSLITYPLWHLRLQERQADDFALKLKDGKEGFIYGFSKAKIVAQEMREKNNLSFFQKLALKFSILPSGTPLSFLFSHGNFDERIERAKKS